MTFMRSVAASANAAVVTVTGVTGSHGGNWAGTLDKMIDGSGMDRPDASDPSTWTAISNAYQDEWQTQAFLIGATNSKIAWCVFDLGSSTNGLQDLYLWNVREQADRGTGTYNMYYGNSPTVPLPPAPETNTLGIDYDFASGGWTLLNTSGVLTLAQKGEVPAPADGVVALGNISARYIGLEMLTNQGSTRANVGLAEVAFTAPDDPNFPFVNAGDDMITWSGEPVPLDPNITEAEGSDWTDLTYDWSAEPDTGVVFTATDVKAPTVTITKATDNPSVVTLTLAVNNEGRVEPPLTSTMTIDVYDDSCTIAKGIDPEAIDPTDLNQDCLTNLGDFAVLAADWLVDYALTEPVPKP